MKENHISQKKKFILNKMKKKIDRSATFVCSLCLKKSDGKKIRARRKYRQKHPCGKQGQYYQNGQIPGDFPATPLL